MRRRSRRGTASIVSVLGIVAVVALVFGAALLESRDAGSSPADPRPTSLDLPTGTTLESMQRAEVVNVIDGDTIDVRLAGKTQRVRYYGVDTPERGDPCYQQATERNRRLVSEGVLLLPDARAADRFDRLLRYIFLPDGTSVDATLVAEGYGHAWREDGRYRNQIIVLEHEADAANRGCLWGGGS